MTGLGLHQQIQQLQQQVTKMTATTTASKPEAGVPILNNRQAFEKLSASVWPRKGIFTAAPGDGNGATGGDDAANGATGGGDAANGAMQESSNTQSKACKR